MSFKASENATEGTGLSFLDVPYLGPCRLQSIEIKEINGTPNCVEFTFGNLSGTDYSGDPVPSGAAHTHTEWAPSSQDDDDKIQNKVDRIAYIIGRVAPKEKVESVEATNWEGYIKAMKQLAEQHDYVETQLYMKAQGNVYNGKPRIKFPGYRDFLSTEENGLSWSAKEKASNEEYLNALRSPASMAEEDEVIDNVEEAGF